MGRIEGIGSIRVYSHEFTETASQVLEDVITTVQYRFHRYETTTPAFFDGIVPEPHTTVAEKLHDSSLEVSYIAFPKCLADLEKGSPTLATSNWVYRPRPFASYQLHIDLFERTTPRGEPVVHVFSHHEPNWLRHPIAHLRGNLLDSDNGRNDLLRLFDEADLPIQTCSSLDNKYPGAFNYCLVRGGA